MTVCQTAFLTCCCIPTVLLLCVRTIFVLGAKCDEIRRFWYSCLC